MVSSANSISKTERILFILGGVAIAIGFIFTLLSVLQICTEACEESHTYRIFGLSFESVGIIYFLLLGLLYFFSSSSPRLSLATGILMAAGLGAEVLFILIQKYSLKHWCPICLGIAGSLLIAALCFASSYLIKLQYLIDTGHRREIKTKVMTALACVMGLVSGFLLAFAGTSQVNKMAREETSLQQKLVFGDLEKPLQVYIFTSWSCPACRKLEPTLKHLSKETVKHAKLVFVDHISDTKTLNFSPYNLSFIINEKPDYFKLRTMLRQVASETESPTDEQIEAAASLYKIKYRQLSYADVDFGIEYFKQLSTLYDISRLPTAVVVNLQSGRHKKLSGTADLNMPKLLEAIEEVKQMTADNTP